MRVLKRVDHSEWRHKFTCERCTSELEADHTDVRAQYHAGLSSPKPGDDSPAYWTYHCTCTVCELEHDLKEGALTKALQHFLQEKTRNGTSQQR
jgi:hypothetical protein